MRGYLTSLKGREKVRVVCIDLSSPYRALLSVLRRHPSRLDSRQWLRLRQLLHDHPAFLPLYEKMIELWDLLRLKHQNARACKHHIAHLLRLLDDLLQSAFEPLVRLGKTLQNWQEALVTMWRFSKKTPLPKASTEK